MNSSRVTVTVAHTVRVFIVRLPLDSFLRSCGYFTPHLYLMESRTYEPAPAFSRGAATECSPGRKPGVGVVLETEPRKGREILNDSFAPTGLRSCRKKTPGSRPGLHSVAAPRLHIMKTPVLRQGAKSRVFNVLKGYNLFHVDKRTN